MHGVTRQIQNQPAGCAKFRRVQLINGGNNVELCKHAYVDASTCSYSTNKETTFCIIYSSCFVAFYWIRMSL